MNFATIKGFTLFFVIIFAITGLILPFQNAYGTTMKFDFTIASILSFIFAALFFALFIIVSTLESDEK